MKYYVNIENGQVNGVSQLDNSKFATDINFQIEITEDIYNDIVNGGIYQYTNGNISKDESSSITALENKKTKELKQSISQEIYEEYPLPKQLDIIGRVGEYTDNDFNTMKSFIEEKIEKYKNQKKL